MKIALPRRINAQIALLLLVCVALFHAAVTSILLFFSPGPRIRAMQWRTRR